MAWHRMVGGGGLSSYAHLHPIHQLYPPCVHVVIFCAAVLCVCCMHVKISLALVSAIEKRHGMRMVVLMHDVSERIVQRAYLLSCLQNMYVGMSHLNTGDLHTK